MFFIMLNANKIKDKKYNFARYIFMTTNFVVRVTNLVASNYLQNSIGKKPR